MPPVRTWSFSLPSPHSAARPRPARQRHRPRGIESTRSSPVRDPSPRSAFAPRTRSASNARSEPPTPDRCTSRSSPAARGTIRRRFCGRSTTVCTGTGPTPGSSGTTCSRSATPSLPAKRDSSRPMHRCAPKQRRHGDARRLRAPGRGRSKRGSGSGGGSGGIGTWPLIALIAGGIGVFLLLRGRLRRRRRSRRSLRR